MGMETDVIIGHFLKAESDIDAIVYSDKFVDTVIHCGDGYFFSNSGNTVFHWSRYDNNVQLGEINAETVNSALTAFKKEISGITDILDTLQIKWDLVYGAKTWVN